MLGVLLWEYDGVTLFLFTATVACTLHLCCAPGGCYRNSRVKDKQNSRPIVLAFDIFYPNRQKELSKYCSLNLCGCQEIGTLAE